MPPPPSSTRDRTSRAQSETSSSLFSPKTPKTGDSTATDTQNLFKISQEDTASCDWFTPTGSDSLFDDVPPTSTTTTTTTTNTTTSTTTTESQQKDPEPSLPESKSSILSQFDVFTELDPLGTGRSKPYVDKKLFFQELKNPPKKVLKDLASTQPSDSSLFTANFDQTTTTAAHTNQQMLFPTDPFVESDPFDKTDPFAESHDPFDTDFIEDFKVFNKQEGKDERKNRYAAVPSQPLFPSPLSKSPNRSGLFEKQMSLQSNHVSREITRQNTFDDKKFGKMSQLHENPSLDMSSEGECAPEPPPRPASNISPIKPPPLPPKKQPGDLSKPPPRPPHSEESHYDYMESYETGISMDALDGPPLPVPARKSRFDQSDFGIAPQRPKKHLPGTSDEDYLTPVPPPLLPPQKKDSLFKSSFRNDGILLPPPRRESSKRSDRQSNPTQPQTHNLSSLLDAKPKVSISPTNLTSDTLDITLSQLTLSGLNELATKLKIPPSQLSNMTLVQLTSYLSNYVKSNHASVPNETDATIPTFKADFAANFNDINNATVSSTKNETYDRYAVFRELLQQEEETKKGETNETIEIQDSPEGVDTKLDLEYKPTFENTTSGTDRYAALREIITQDNEQKESNVDEPPEPKEDNDEKQQNDLNVETKTDKNDVENNIIEYEEPPETKEKLNIDTPDKSPAKSPVPVTEIIQTNNHVTSGSLSDAVTGSSPEMDNLANSETVEKKNVENTNAGESWAIFDAPNIRPEAKEKVQSEEGVSPWSSDSKEFGNGSPLDWQQRRDSESEGDWGRKKKDGAWWEAQGEIEGNGSYFRFRLCEIGSNWY